MAAPPFRERPPGSSSSSGDCPGGRVWVSSCHVGHRAGIHDGRIHAWPFGPVQLIVLGFDHPEFQGEIVEELGRLRESDTVRVIDALAVHKDAEGEITVEQLSNLTGRGDRVGAKIGALVGLGAAGEEGRGARRGRRRGGEDGVNFCSDDEEVWDVLAEIPNDTAAALLLIEHHWAVPLRDAIARAGGFRIADGFISPLDLVAIGLLTAAEAEAQAEALKPSATV